MLEAGLQRFRQYDLAQLRFIGGVEPFERQPGLVRVELDERGETSCEQPFPRSCAHLVQLLNKPVAIAVVFRALLLSKRRPDQISIALGRVRLGNDVEKPYANGPFGKV